MEILKTKDYDLFKEINSNREVDQRHVRSLVAAIEQKNLLHVNPIVCNAGMEVIDGLQDVKEELRRLSEEEIIHVIISSDTISPVQYTLDNSV